MLAIFVELLYDYICIYMLWRTELQQNANYVVAFFDTLTTERKLCGQHQSQPLHLPRVDGAALGGVDPGGVDAGVAQKVRQPG